MSAVERCDQQESVDTREAIRALLAAAPLAVLCTQGEGQPYGSLVAYAYSADLRQAAFVTPKATRKYALLSACDRVALVIDNRDAHPTDPMRVSALTATGRAAELAPGAEWDRWAQALVARHPYLVGLVHAPDVALFGVDLTRYLYVSQLQKVAYWTPPAC